MQHCALSCAKYRSRPSFSLSDSFFSSSSRQAYIDGAEGSFLFIILLLQKCQTIHSINLSHCSHDGWVIWIMMDECEQRGLQYFLMDLSCEGQSWPFCAIVAAVDEELGSNIGKQIAGCIIMGCIAGLSSLAGLGGGGPNIVVLIIFFDVLPKDATIAVFACIVGSSFGNLVNQMQTAYNNEPMIRYQYAFVVLPMMFIGSLIGVLLNRFLPSIAIVAIIIGVASHSLPKIYQRFKDAHERQTEQLLEHRQNERNSDIIKQTRINPFAEELNVRIFKQLGMLVICYVCLAVLRGSQKFPSLLGITSCSLQYWVLEVVIFLMAFWFYRFNKNSLELWTAPKMTLGEELFEKQDLLEDNKLEVMQKAIGAGIFSGFGLGGGIFLVPLFRLLGLNPLQATATCSFTIFITSGINCLQAIFFGVLSFRSFLFLFGIASLGSFFVSLWISNLLRRFNRLSFVELLLVFLLLAANINLPISLWFKYVNSGAESVIGFGSLC